MNIRFSGSLKCDVLGPFATPQAEAVAQQIVAAVRQYAPIAKASDLPFEVTMSQDTKGRPLAFIADEHGNERVLHPQRRWGFWTEDAAQLAERAVETIKAKVAECYARLKGPEELERRY